MVSAVPPVPSGKWNDQAKSGMFLELCYKRNEMVRGLSPHCSSLSPDLNLGALATFFCLTYPMSSSIPTLSHNWFYSFSVIGHKPTLSLILTHPPRHTHIHTHTHTRQITQKRKLGGHSHTWRFLPIFSLIFSFLNYFKLYYAIASSLYPLLP